MASNRQSDPVVRHAANPWKFLMFSYNLVILAAGLILTDKILSAGFVFASLIGVQFHFTVFGDSRDTHWLHRADLIVATGGLLILLVKFLVLTGGGR